MIVQLRRDWSTDRFQLILGRVGLGMQWYGENRMKSWTVKRLLTDSLLEDSFEIWVCADIQGFTVKLPAECLEEIEFDQIETLMQNAGY